MHHPLILTLQLDQRAFAALDALRTAHFPPERNFVPAHITLFHALPGAEEPLIRDQLAALAATTAPFTLSLPAPRFMGRGVALAVECPDLVTLRGALARSWALWLSPQDRQPYGPHVTIQNKVPPAEARALYEELAASWSDLSAEGLGLLLWRYLGGPWELAADFAFART